MFENLDAVQIIRELSKLAYQLGPFLFAILFTIYISRWAHKMYKEACTRKDPVATNREKNISMVVYLAVITFSIILVIGSVIWWFYNPPKNYKFEGKIQNLKDYQQTFSHSFFLKPSYFVKPEINLVSHDDHFILVRDKPLESGEIFDIAVTKKNSEIGSEEAIDKFEIVYNKRDYVIYTFGFDQKTGKAFLKEVCRKQKINIE